MRLRASGLRTLRFRNVVKPVILASGEPDVAVEQDLAALLAPYEDGRNGGKWDWYQIGGRWSAFLRGVCRSPVNAASCPSLMYVPDILQWCALH